MKRLFFIFFAALALSACQSIPDSTGAGKTPHDIAARVCPPLQGVLALLPVTAGVSQDTLDAVAEAAPYVESACAAGAADALDLKLLATRAAPLLLKAVSASGLSDGEKQAAIVAIVAAQVLLSQWSAP